LTNGTLYGYAPARADASASAGEKTTSSVLPDGRRASCTPRSTHGACAVAQDAAAAPLLRDTAATVSTPSRTRSTVVPGASMEEGMSKVVVKVQTASAAHFRSRSP